MNLTGQTRAIRWLVAAAFLLAACGGGSTKRMHPEIAASVTFLDFETVPPKAFMEKQIEVSNPGLATLKIDSITVIQEHGEIFSVSGVRSEVASASSFPLTVALSAPAEPGFYGARIEIESTADAAPKLVIPLSVRVALTCDNVECDRHATCIETDRGPQCRCLAGFIGDGSSCTDVNECATNNGDCGPVPANLCTNTEGAHTCSCQTGYALDGEGLCVDVNECLVDNGGCGPIEANICTNTEGTSECSCQPGYAIDGSGLCVDVNECATNNGDCGPVLAHFCTNTAGSHACSCQPGYAWDGNGLCADVNECLTDNGGCGPIAANLCTNRAGTSECSCQPGYATDASGHCVDINECLTNNGGCGPIAAHLCTNTVGSSACTCQPGYAWDASGTCVDMNECLIDNGHCGPIAANLCTNSEGSHLCACQPGYAIDGSGLCTDVDECATNNGGCGPTAANRCTNLEGSYTCSCQPGYSADTNGLCADVNECLTDNGGCGSTTANLCTNTAGAHTCSCRPGYALDGNGLCVDVNECLTNNGGCGPIAANLCTNIDGSSSCSCRAGYATDASGHCVDVNECLVDNGDCGPVAANLCQNAAGSSTCSCQPGYQPNASGLCVRYTFGPPVVLATVPSGDCGFAEMRHAVVTSANGSSYVAAGEVRRCDTRIDALAVHTRSAGGAWSRSVPFSPSDFDTVWGYSLTWGWLGLMNTSMALDATGAPHILAENYYAWTYQRTTYSGAAYVSRSASGWQTTENVFTSPQIVPASSESGFADWNLAWNPFGSTLVFTARERVPIDSRGVANVVEMTPQSGASWNYAYLISVPTVAANLTYFGGVSEDFNSTTGVEVWVDQPNCRISGRERTAAGLGSVSIDVPLQYAACDSNWRHSFGLGVEQLESLLAPDGTLTLLVSVHPVDGGASTLIRFTRVGSQWTRAARVIDWHAWRGFADASGRPFILHTNAAENALSLFDVNADTDTLLYTSSTRTIQLPDAERHDPKIATFVESESALRTLNVVELQSGGP